eukprot:CAMPEP_0171743048 /NCGR_PEP_ID=MMETSP0991-20121206/36639_1 /TAXON_ID=483369 /ORGANISM="non described non described, Strain CCMP2098" /LENGTH=77 /DNA_ID=CAMNT_0012341867 /DNA_START=280 /DNA_END=510 /DNA_ORIENTATION=+
MRQVGTLRSFRLEVTCRRMQAKQKRWLASQSMVKASDTLTASMHATQSTLGSAMSCAIFRSKSSRFASFSLADSKLT